MSRVVNTLVALFDDDDPAAIPATPKQLRALKALGYRGPTTTLGKAEAGLLLRVLTEDRIRRRQLVR